MFDLPQELLDAIVDNVDNVHDATTLRSCALIATSFRAPCQRVLFRTLWLYRERSQRRPSLEEASALFTASPHLASYVRDLTVELTDIPPESAALEVALRALAAANLERLVLLGRSTKWTGLGHGTAAALLACLALPSLRRLHLMNLFRVPSAVLAAAMAIPVVSLYRVLLNTREDLEVYRQSHESIASPRLRHLILTDSPFGAALPIFDWLLHSRDPPYTASMKRLELRLEPDSHGSGHDQRLLASCSGTLEYLVIDPGGILLFFAAARFSLISNTTALVRQIIIPHLPLVRTVELKVFVDYRRRLPSFFSSTIANIASALPLVETIDLRFIVELLDPEPAWDDPAAGHVPVFDPSFANRSQLLHLRSVHCKLSVRGVPYPMALETPFARFVAAMGAWMPGLRDAGFLVCSLEDPQRYIDRLP
ncbi:hypothetical protein GGX14DRAFT_672652 [Mycena pura]|uniref:F-box domain-containing protein n=1 Tax=Mycena pura TaxID=153505 RepID=A0AAD6V3I0_9AGAR|nr:hypothetical protein GGX14DRAFT_672652 [Mycena pura]